MGEQITSLAILEIRIDMAILRLFGGRWPTMDEIDAGWNEDHLN